MFRIRFTELANLNGCRGLGSVYSFFEVRNADWVSLLLFWDWDVTCVVLRLSALASLCYHI